FEAFEEAGGHDDKCPSVTGNAAKWTAKVLLDEGIEPTL
ncbi:MAG: CGCAxxGCC family protein, partial [Methanohalophilus sp.]